ncbi:MAG: hypothetical protein ABSE39_03380 [Candidatus Bathyarchaeia archaeon]
MKRVHVEIIVTGSLLVAALVYTALFPGGYLDPSLVVEVFKALVEVGGVLLGLVGVIGVFGLTSIRRGLFEQGRSFNEMLKTMPPNKEWPKWQQSEIDIVVSALSALDALQNARVYFMALVYCLSCFVGEVLAAVLGIAYADDAAMWHPLLLLSAVGLLQGCYWLYVSARMGSGFFTK